MQKAVTSAKPAHSDQLQSWLAEGQQSLEAIDARAACRAFERLLQAALTQANTPAVHEAMHRAAVGLGDCLALSQEAEVREAALRALFQAYQADAGVSVDGLTREIPFLMLQGAHPGERSMLSRWVREALTAHDGVPDEAYWRLLLDLADASPAPMEALLDECRAAGHPGLVAEKLLDMERVGEALITARRELKDTADLLRFANSPAAHGQVRAVMALVAERLLKSFDPALADWLAERYAERGDLQRALEVRMRLLRAAPGRGDYAHVEELARRLGTWETLQPELARMLQRSRREEALAELALGEGDPERALAYVVRAPERYGTELLARLADYAAENRPEWATHLYHHLLERTLAGEPGAGDVGEYLARLHQAYERLGALDAWEACVEELQQRFGLRV